MLTSRGWWLLLTLVAVVVVALLGVAGMALDTPFRMTSQPHVTVALLGLTFGLWFAFEWLLFTLRWRSLRRRLSFTRELRDDRNTLETLWAKRTFRVRISLTLSGRFSVPLVRVGDLIPAGTQKTAGPTQYQGPIAPGQSVELAYFLQSQTIGRIRFEGLRLRITDRHGLFYGAHFLRDGAEYRVLPPLANASGHSPTMKRHNLLPPPGVHRLHRAGSGSELLDLRDYLPGDPPKTIAWKASARRDRLITKEFESEVPIRCTLFVDTSNSVRLGPPGKTALTQIVEIASNVIQAAASERDLVGLCLFDDRATTYVRPARTSGHVIHLINLLTDAAGLSPFAAEANIEVLQPLAYSYARRVYPELLQPEVNHAPAWLPWVFPPRADTMRQPTWRAKLHSWTPLIIIFYLLTCLIMAWMSFGLFRHYLIPPNSIARSSRPVYVVYVIVLALTVAMVSAIMRLPAHFLPELRRDFRRRKQLASLLTIRHDLPTGALATLLEDEEGYALQLQQFLAEHRVPYAPPLSESLGQSAFASRNKVSILADALLRAVSRGHDNELFVLLVNLLEVHDHLEPLLRAARVAVSRHHRVILVCPWPDYSSSFQHLRKSFARLGIVAVPARGQDPAKLILNRLDRLRMQGRRR